MDGSLRKKGRIFLLFAIVLTLSGLVIPGISAAVPADTLRVTPFVTNPDISVTNGSLASHTLPSEYRATPTLLTVQVELPETALPASKGEMAAGPRAIGFATDPVSLAIAILAIVLAAAGIRYLLKRKRDEEERK